MHDVPRVTGRPFIVYLDVRKQTSTEALGGYVSEVHASGHPHALKWVLRDPLVLEKREQFEPLDKFHDDEAHT